MNRSGFQAVVICLCTFSLWSGGVRPSLAATFTVTSHSAAGTGTLAEAATEANTTPGVDTINFALAGSQLITLDGSLNFYQPVILDGGQTVVLAMNPSQSTSPILQFLTGSAGSTIKDIALTRSYCGIFLLSGQHRIAGCAIGTDWAQAAGIGNSIGALVNGQDVQIGGPLASDRNLISGNSQYGILADGAVNLIVQGNYIGTDASGTMPLANALGVLLQGATTGALIGGTRGPTGTLGEGNLFAGNVNHLQISGAAATGNTVCGNLFGLTPDQSASLAGSNGIFLNATTGNLIGLPAPGQENVICGQSSSGISVGGSPGSSRNLIRNNLIGVNESGLRFPNGSGILLSGNSNLVGGDRAFAIRERNVISGNLDYGILLQGNGNTVCGNLIGLTPDGSAAAGNLAGIYLTGNGNIIGGSNADPAHPRGNVISGHIGNLGILQLRGSDNWIRGNWIGLDGTGMSAMPNRWGVFINNTVARRTLVGGAGEGNVIAGNLEYGVMFDITEGHVMSGNWIGLNAAGARRVNGGDGIILQGAAGILIGGNGAGEGNWICAAGNGIMLSEGGTTGNTLIGNHIGVLADGSPAGQIMTAAVRIEGWSCGNWVGLPNGGGNNLMTRCANGIVSDGGEGNGLYGNTITAFTGLGVQLLAGGNQHHPPPLIGFASPGLVSGTAVANDTVEVFLAEPGRAGLPGGTIRLLGTAAADGAGRWSLAVSSLAAGEYVCALATNATRNTSQISANAVVLDSSTPAPTRTPTATQTATPVVTETPTTTTTETPTSTHTPTVVLTLTSSATPTASRTATTAATLTATSTATGTSAATPAAQTATPTRIPKTATPTTTPSMTATAARTSSPITPGGLTGGVVLAPNPARDRVRCWVNLDEAAELKLAVYNLSGERLAVITSAGSSGSRVLEWDCRYAARGIYLVQVYRGGTRIASRKIALTR